jgi:hypothetical protein
MMKRRKVWVRAVWCLTLIPLVACLNHATAAVSPPKAKPAAVATKAAAKPEQYAVLNPRADFPPIDAKALAPRLATLEGKTVYVYGSDYVMNPGLEIMLMIARGLAQAVPNIKVVYISDRYGDATADSVVPAVRIAKYTTDAHHYDTFKEAEKGADAVVTGLGY